MARSAKHSGLTRAKPPARHRIEVRRFGQSEHGHDAVIDALSAVQSIRFHLSDGTWIDVEARERDGEVGLSIMGERELVIVPRVANALVIKSRP